MKSRIELIDCVCVSVVYLIDLCTFHSFKEQLEGSASVKAVKQVIPTSKQVVTPESRFSQNRSEIKRKENG